jgi:4-aminobutyrate aminotransferase-like enzyme
MLCRLYTGSSKILSLRNGYHGLVGNTQGLTNVGTWNQPVNRGYDHTTLSFPSSYRGIHQNMETYIK